MMRKFFASRFGRLLTFPFRALWWLFLTPRRVYFFFTSEPSSHSLGEILTAIAQQKEYRAALLQEASSFRGHILRSIAWWFIATGIALFFVQRLTLLAVEPLSSLGTLAPSVLTTVEVTESISVLMRLALMAGFIVSFPLIAFEFWYFAAPGLMPKEKIRAFFGIPLATLLFATGVLFCYYYLLPSALNAMRLLNDYLGYATQWRPDSYFKFTTGLLFWMGIMFEFPILIGILSSIGLVGPKTLVRNWRIAVVIISVIAAMITPTVDPFTMGLVMAPMVVLYFISILISLLTYKQQAVSAKIVS